MPADTSTLPAQPARDLLAPHRFTWDEVVRFAAADAFGETTRVELIEGEIFVMPEEGFLHVDAVYVLQRWLFANVSLLGFDIRIREPVHLPGGHAFIPDLSVFPAGTTARDMMAARAELIIEVADGTEQRDRILKLPRYAEAGVKEVWQVHARSREVTTHRAPKDGAWTFVERHGAPRTLSPICAPAAAFDPADLPVPPEEPAP